VVLGVLIFLLSLALLFFAARNYWRQFGISSAFLFDVSPVYWIAIGLAAGTYFLLDCLRVSQLLKLIGTRVSLLDSLRALAVAELASFLVPTGVLYLPTAIVVLTGEGVNSGDATAAIVTRTVYSVIWYSLAGFLALAFTQDVTATGLFSANVIYYLLPVIGTIVFFAVSVAFAPRLHRWIQSKVMGRFRKGWMKYVFRWLDRTEADIGTIGHSTSRYHLYVHLSSIGMVLMYGTIGYLLAHSAGLQLSVASAMCIFSISLLLIEISPASGTIGVSEAVTAFLLNKDFGSREIFVAVALRIVARYVLLVPGILLLLFFRTRTLKEKESDRAMTRKQPVTRDPHLASDQSGS
jgi:uncharacterized membrane protein YbhN (UPF0104 family)